MISRRSLLEMSAALAAGSGARGTTDLVVRDLRLSGRRALFVTPPDTNGPVPLLVLLHGLGETGDSRAGAYAWWDRYGLSSAHARLCTPPVARTSKHRYFTDEALATVNAKLVARPFGPFAYLCPHVPNAQTPAAVRPFADWLIEKALREVGGMGVTLSSTSLAGCSLGSFIAFETFLFSPSTFHAIGGVQSAIGVTSAQRYANAFVSAGLEGSRIYLSTSTGDPYRAPTRALAAALVAKGVTPVLHEAPGPHDQPWLREVGTLELLLAMHYGL